MLLRLSVSQYHPRKQYIRRNNSRSRPTTGITYEPWHLRYVGVQVAQYMRDNHLCLEEFTQEWKEAVAEYEAAER